MRVFCRSLSSATKSNKLVLGCGSNVVDRFHRVRKVPPAGEKGYFASAEEIEAGSVVGGVTLNHLAWASVLGAPTGLLALQGNDETGKQIRSKMQDLGVATDFIQVSDGYRSSVSMIFVQSDGERSIIMAPAGTGLIDGSIVKKHFHQPILSQSSMVTTEISQVPLSGVEALLKAGKEAGVITALDVDVPPSVAITEAKLGDAETLKRVVRQARVVKPTLESATELFKLFDVQPPKALSSHSPQNNQLDKIAAALRELLGCDMLAITNGKNGSSIATAKHSVIIPCFSVDKVVDTTGAGDAFFGGLVAGLHHLGLPGSKNKKESEDLALIGKLASAAGAANVQVLGALPDEKAKNILAKYLGEHSNFITTSTTSTSSKESSPYFYPFVRSLQSDLQTLTHVTTYLSQSQTQENILNFVEQFFNRKSSGEPCQIFITAVGKSGIVGQRFAASLSSIGVSAQYVHGVEFLHGDLGKVQKEDLVVMLSYSGNTPELFALLPHLQKRNARVISIVGNADSKLAKTTSALVAPVDSSSEHLGVVPAGSIIAQESVINAIVGALIARIGLDTTTFKFNHPGGAIGNSA